MISSTRKKTFLWNAASYSKIISHQAIAVSAEKLILYLFLHNRQEAREQGWSQATEV